MNKKLPAKNTYEPTESERIALGRLLERREAAQPRPKLKVTNSELVDNARNVKVEIDHDDAFVGWNLMTASLGARSARVTEMVVDQVCALVQTKNGVDGTAANRMLALVQEIAPQDTLEAMLAVQMAAVHMATIKQAQLLNGLAEKPSMVRHMDSTSTALNKLARTFTTQMDALKRHRSKAEQRVIVEHQHVHVYPGGQAVVGNVTQGGDGKKEGQPHERQMRLSESAAVLGSIEADEMPVQGTSGEGLERVPVSRGKGRTALRAVE